MRELRPVTVAIWALLVLLMALVLWRPGPLADFDFGSGLVRCGVDHFPPSCSGTAP